jgi:hypothetical protein
MHAFRCMHCQRVCVSSWSEEDAEQEYRENFPHCAIEEVERGVLCTFCYKLFMTWFASLSEWNKDRVRRGQDLVQ